MNPLLLLLLALGAAPNGPKLFAMSSTCAPKIDGVLDDAVWKRASHSSIFTQKFPDSGRAPTATTTVAIFHDGSALYFGIRCDQPTTPIVARLARRDRRIESDDIAIDIDTRGDGKNAYHFELNAAGHMLDAIRFDQIIGDDGDLFVEWDENWQGSTKTTTSGWSAEVRIPFRVLRFDERSHAKWGLEVRRHISELQEVDEWAYVARDVAGEMLHYGEIEIDGEADPGGSIELRPFVLARAGDLEPGTKWGSAGGDARLHLTRDSTFDLSINPDFGQVEADQVVLNLTSFELLFPEKRPFFLEGASVFNTPLSMLYTRRIGHDAIPIYAAGKLIGRTAGGTSIGALAAVTGEHRTETIESRALYSAFRVAADAGEHATLGAIGTAVHRFPALSLAAPEHNAYAGGVDGRWRSSSGDYTASGQIAGVAIDGGAPRMLLDGTMIRGGDFDFGGTGRFAKEGGNWLFELEYHNLGRKFDISDTGYLERQNLQRFWFAGARRDTDLSGIFLENKTQIEIYHRRNFDGLNLAEGYQLNNRGKFSNFMEYFAELHYRAAHFDDRELGTGVALERAGLVGLELYVASDPRAPVVGELSTTTQRLTNGVYLALDGRITLRVLPELDLDLLPEALYTSGEPRYIGDDDAGVHLFGRQRAAGAGLTLRATYTFTPNVSLQAYAQLFADVVRYTKFLRASGDKRTIVLSELEPTAAPAQRPDTEEITLNANVVLRWEFMPGSTLFLVYTRAQFGALDFETADGSPQLGLRALRGSRSTDVVLAKLTYWWGS